MFTVFMENPDDRWYGCCMLMITGRKGSVPITTVASAPHFTVRYAHITQESAAYPRVGRHAIQPIAWYAKAGVPLVTQVISMGTLQVPYDIPFEGASNTFNWN